jgi:hypothetical protein
MLQHLSELAHPPLPLAHPRNRPAGVPAGTLVRTDEGEVPVEFLLAGDRVLTRKGPVELRGTSVIELRRAELVSIRPAALRDTQPRPDRPLVVPASQPVLIRDWRAMLIHGTDEMLVPASALVDDLSVTRERRDAIRLIRLHFDTPQVFWADGVELASARRRAPVTVTPPPALLH